MSNRRDFLKSAGILTAAATVLNPATIFAQKGGNKRPGGSKIMQLSFVSYDAEMKHVFTIANSSRTTTPIVLTKITYDGVTGYGEAAMPPYLGETQASVIEFLKKVDLSIFSSPFLIEDIMMYVEQYQLLLLLQCC